MAHIRIVNIRKWFPPSDPLAASVARLCILREDFAIEMQGVYQEEIDALDRHSAAWRRTYFIRNLVRTLMEVMSTMNSLKLAPEFMALLERQSEPVRAKFNGLFQAMIYAHPIVKRIRNTICGHVKHSAVQDALNGMNHDRWGFLEVGRREAPSVARRSRLPTHDTECGDDAPVDHRQSIVAQSSVNGANTLSAASGIHRKNHASKLV